MGRLPGAAQGPAGGGGGGEGAAAHSDRGPARRHAGSAPIGSDAAPPNRHSPKRLYGTEIGPVLTYSQGLAACRAGATVEAQKNPPGAGPSGLREYWRLR